MEESTSLVMDTGSHRQGQMASRQTVEGWVAWPNSTSRSTGQEGYSLWRMFQRREVGG